MVGSFGFKGSVKATAAFLLTGLLVLSGCDLITGTDDVFSVWTEDRQLVLRNGLDEIVRYWAVESVTAQLALMKVQLTSLEPGEEKRIPYEDLIGYTPGDEQVNVYWRTESEGPQPFITVEL